jgi:RNA-directed DNA polymerase
MLTALENGVKGGLWFSVIDKVWAPANLAAAWERVRANKGAAGIDGQTVADFATQAPSSLAWLHEQLRTGRYRPAAVRRTWIPKPGSDQRRPLGIPRVVDRIVQGALKNVLEPIFEREFVAHSYGFRPNRSAKDALRHVERCLRAGYTHVVDADIEAFFDRLDHGLLRAALQTRIADGRVLDLVDAFLRQRVVEGLTAWTPTQGAPQGAVLSPLLSNVYLHPLDVALRAAGIEAVRYADDLVLLCHSAEAAQAARAVLTTALQSLRLTLHPTKTRVVDVREPGGFDFLGYHFERGYKSPRRKSWNAFRATVRTLTPRKSGDSMPRIVDRLNRMLRGWFEYFKHSTRETFTIADGFVRRRLRAILARRHRRAHRFGNAGAHVRWPNAYFANEGLFSCATTHRLARQA